MLRSFNNLVEKGYFPLELPPPFTTSSLAQALPIIMTKVPPFITQRMSWKKKSKCCLHSIPRRSYARRNLCIPNPLHQILLCNYIAANLQYLQKFIRKSTLSLSKPVADPAKKRAYIRFADYPQLNAERAKKSPGRRYFLYTDISRYYGTIYTHSIPWALYGKDFAKKYYSAQNKYRYIGIKLDRYLRDTQDQQTIGIPTGPDTSLIISEILGTAIDEKLIREINQIKSIRYMDDFYVYFKEEKDAEDGLSKLHHILKDFELEINPHKTMIRPLPEKLEEDWIIDLSLFSFSNKDPEIQSKEILRFFTKIFDFTKKFPDEPVLNYALTIIKKYKIMPKNWPLYESLLLQSLNVQTSIFPIITEIFVSYLNDQDYKFDFPKIADCLNELITYHSKFDHSYEVAWGLWLANTVNITIEEQTAMIVSNMDDSIVALIALDMNSKGLIRNGLNITKWSSMLSSNHLYDEYWLLAYESNIKNWITGPQDFVSKDRFFKILKKNGVEFYAPGRQVVPIDFKEIINKEKMETIEFQYEKQPSIIDIEKIKKMMDDLEAQNAPEP